jgi:hypothetical protein
MSFALVCSFRLSSDAASLHRWGNRNAKRIRQILDLEAA